MPASRDCPAIADDGRGTPTAADLDDRKFATTAPAKLWVADITEHAIREGKVYCAVVLDTYSRRVVGSDLALCPCGTRTCASVTSTSSTPATSRPAPAYRRAAPR
ncbi:DDE-type integrase/transposase/recombinase [Streptomyces sp. NPDC057746]|uniref:DDE-type integrase/transposase/recombinase n=1 Tax=Streptomyces sp. NPDC057746 TaxID=3346237 RepID=UPI0036C2D4BF